MVQLSLNLTLVCTILACFPLIFVYNSRVAYERNDMRAHENNPIYSRANLVNANLVTSINKSLEMSLDTNLTCKLFAMHTHFLIYMPYASSKGQFQHGEAKHGEAKNGEAKYGV